MGKIFQRKCRERFTAGNRSDVIDRAVEKYHEVMQHSLPDAVTDSDQNREIDLMIKAADTEILNQDNQTKCVITYR